MRTLSAAETVKVGSGSYAPALRVSLEDAGGVFRDVDSYFGDQRFLMGVSLQEDVDGQGPTASIQLRRQVFEHSLSPLMLSSGTARGYVPSASPSPPVALYRRVRVEFYIAAVDELVSSPSWTELFVGRIDRISVADGESVTLECRDANVAVLSDSFFERERLYGLTPAAYAYQKGCLIWAPGETQAVGDICVPAKLNGYLYRATSITTGVTGSTQPNWPTVVGNTVTDGGVTWTCGVATASAGTVSMEAVLQQMLNDSPVSLTLYAPDATSFLMSPWKQEREPVLESMRKVAQLIGWDLRPRYDSGGTYRFQLYKPDRAASSPARTFAPASYVNVTALDMGIEDVRNVVRVVYGDSTDLGSDGKSPRRKYAQVSNAASISAYGRRFMEIAEEATSQIDTAAEATALANAALADLSTPYASLGVEAFFFPWTQLGDLYRFSANNVHFDSDQDLAVVGYSHEAQLGDDGEQTFRTSLTCRGKPSGGSDRWLQWDSRPGVAPTHSLQDSLGGADLTVVDAGAVVGGARFRIAEKLSRLAKWDGVELHISPSSGFTPSSTTLAAYSKAETVEVGNLNPGTTYYARIVPRQLNAGRIVLGEPSEQVSFTAGYVTTGKLDAGAVTSAKIADFNITTAKLSRATDPGGAAVSAVNLQDTAVTKVYRDNVVTAVESLFKKSSDTFASVAGTIASNQFGTGVVGTTALATGAVTPAKLAAIDFSSLTQNPLFDFWSSGSGSVPDGWTLQSGTWGTDLTQGGSSPDYYLTLPNTATAGTLSAPLIRLTGTSGQVQYVVDGADSGSGGTLGRVTDFGLRIDWLDSGLSLISSDTFYVSRPGSVAGGNGLISGVASAAYGASYARVVVGRLRITQSYTGYIYRADASVVAYVAPDSVGTGELADYAVTSAKLATNIAVAGTLSSAGASSFATSSGNVGVGTGSPGTKLDVSGTARASGSFAPNTTSWTSAAFRAQGSYGGGLALVDGAAGFGFWTDTNGANLRIGQGATSGGLSTHVTLDSSGNMGVGTQSPGTKLDVVGYIRSTSGAANLTMYHDGTNAAISSSSSVLVYAGGANPIILHTNGTERLRITSTGNVGIGTANPAAKLAVSTGDARKQFVVDVSSDPVVKIGTPDWYNVGALAFVNGSAGERMRIDANGKVGIGATSPEEQLEVRTAASAYGLLHSDGTRKVGSYVDTTGGWYGTKSNHDLKLFTNGGSSRLTITAAGDSVPGAGGTYMLGASGTRWKEIWCTQSSINSTSDERQKTDITESDLGLDFIEALRPVRYRWKVGQSAIQRVPDGESEDGTPKYREEIVPVPGKRPHYGFLAQHVAAVLGSKDFAGFIYDEDSDVYGLRYSEFIAPLVKAVQELSARVRQLEQQLAEKESAP